VEEEEDDVEDDEDLNFAAMETGGGKASSIVARAGSVGCSGRYYLGTSTPLLITQLTPEEMLTPVARVSRHHTRQEPCQSGATW
jgi:hypothetical protein